MTRYLLLLSLLTLGFSCKKDSLSSVSKPINPPVEDGFYGSPYFGLPDSVNDWVIYEVNLRAFSQHGDLEGVTQRLDSIKALGVNVIWLMPIHPIGQLKGINSPYCVRDYKAVSSEYGDLEDLRRLVDAAHLRNMAVIMDFVANHTAWDHPWINSHPSWYTKDANGNIVHPPGTNWLDVADLNFNVDSMQVALIEAMKYWLREANIDGYRCDYANGVPFSFWQRAIDSLENYHRSNLLMLAEGDRFNHLVAGFDLRFSWAFYDQIKKVFRDGDPASILSAFHQGEYNVVVGNKGILRFITNHDESAWDATPVQIFGSQEKALAAMVANTFLGGVPLIYGSQEVGRNTQLPFFTNDPINWNANPTTLAAYQEFMRIYQNEPAARVQTITDFSSDEVLSFLKEKNGTKLLVIVNSRNSNQNYSVDAVLQQSSWVNLQSGLGYNLNSSISLAANDYLILRSN